MKNIFLRTSALAAFALLTVYSTSAAAFDRAQGKLAPQMQINLNALDNLDENRRTPVENPVPVTVSDNPFGAPSKPLMKKPSKHVKKHTAKHKKKHKVACDCAPKPEAAQATTTPEVRIVSGKEKPAKKTKHKLKPVPAEPMPAESQELPAVAAPVPEPMPVPVTPIPAAKEVKPLEPLPDISKPVSEVPPVPSKSITPITPLPIVPTPAPMAPAPAAVPEVKELAPLPPTNAPVPVPPSVPSKDNTIKPLEPLPLAPLPVPESSATPPTLPSLPDVSKRPSAAAPELPALPTLPSTDNAKPGSNATSPVSDKQSSATTGAGPDLRIVFSDTQTDVPLDATAKLDTVAKQMVKNPAMRVSITAYASGSDAASIYPKRVSLARGISVRNYLVSNKNIDVERVTVKALGNKNDDGGPANRVDLVLLK